MTGPTTWGAANDHYLAAALEWLRLLLARQAHEATPETPALLAEQPDRPWWSPAAWGRSRTPDQPAAEMSPPPEEPSYDARIAEAAAAMAAAAATHAPPALAGLAELLGLSRFECDTLLLCVARELDPTIGELCARAQGDPRMTYPTFALAFVLFPDPAWDVLAPHRPLRHWRLVEISQPAGAPLVTSPLRADERIANHLKGLDYLDDRLGALVTAVPAPAPGSGPLPPSQQALVDEIADHWRGGVPAVVQLLGADSASKQLVASHVAAELGLVLHRMPAGLLPGQPAELDQLARLWEREARLLPLALYLDADEVPGTSPDASPPPVARFLARSGGAFLLATRESHPGVEGPTITVDVAPPTPAERLTVWRRCLADKAAAAALSAQFALDSPTIAEIAAVSGGDPAKAWHACQLRTRPQLDMLARRVEPKVTWSDIVLPAEDLAALRQIADQVAQRTTVYDSWGFAERASRGLGIGALFAGPSGVGKTMAAEVLAGHLGLDLYCIDLSTVVNKYIGETEKNLRRLFDAGERGGAILFFDEADALFGKRSEVRDAHDRYANIEINYLLQRMESYRGLAILATNLRKALDTAFLRRLRFVVDFRFPGAAERRAIWERALPPRAPRHLVDFDRLARLPASGGMVRNIALNAAFAAAAGGSDITMPLLLAAARAEFRKLGLPVAERDFAWTAPAGVAR